MKVVSKVLVNKENNQFIKHALLNILKGLRKSSHSHLLDQVNEFNQIQAEN